MTPETFDIGFGEVDRSGLSEKIANRLLSLIKEKRLRPGDRLPPERELALMMKVSRPSLREALRALQLMNIIENRQGSGNYITSLEPEQLVEHLDIVFALDDSTYRDLFQARRILETGIAEMAALNITDEEVLRMEESLSKATAVIDDADAFLEADMELHAMILQAAGNRVLPVFMQSINKIGVLSRRRTGEDIEVRRQTVRDHRAIVAALKARNPEKAKKAMMEHLGHVEAGMTKPVDNSKERK
ncbi:MAG: FadR/GntR family transcriptional regulator [Spirochaetota bacterium]|jgi:GntR family transcriptional repressor for pyruvate dehydrogenase complex